MRNSIFARYISLGLILLISSICGNATILQTYPFFQDGKKMSFYPNGYIYDLYDSQVYSLCENEDDIFDNLRGAILTKNITNNLSDGSRNNRIIIPGFIFSEGQFFPVLGIDGAFKNCSVSFIHIPDEVMAIGKHSFENSTNIESLTLPANLKLIEEDAFSGMDSLKELYFRSPLPPSTSIELSPSVHELLTSNDQFIFLDNYITPFGKSDELRELGKNLTIYIPQGSKSFYEAHPIFKKLRFALAEYTPEMATPLNPSISKGMVLGKTSLHELEVTTYYGDEESLIIPQLINSDDYELGVSMQDFPYYISGIGYRAFDPTYTNYHTNNNLISISLDGDLKYIKEEAFCNAGIENISISGKIDKIGPRAFANMKSLKSFTIFPIPEDETNWTKFNDIFDGISDEAVLYYSPMDPRIDITKAPFNAFRNFSEINSQISAPFQDQKGISGCRFSTYPSGMLINSNSSHSYRIDTFDGKNISMGEIKEGLTDFRIEPGCYIVTVSNCHFKIIIR